MSAYFESGFSVREPMWHGMGEVHADYPQDWKEAREWAGLTWEPEAWPVYGREHGSTGDYVEMPDYRRIVRNDTGATLAVRTDGYEVIDHNAMGEIVEALLEVPNVKYETAGSIHGGKKVWALAYLDEPITIPGDNSITLPYLALTNHHDGTGGCKATSTTVKVVCANTFAAAESEGERNSTLFTFRHSAKWRDRIEEARKTIKGVRDDLARYAETAEQLLQVRVTPEQKELFITQFIPAPPETLISDRVMTNVEQARQVVRTILASPTSDGIGDSAWGLVQAAGEYLDHYRTYRTQDSYFRRTLLRTEPLKSKAVKLAVAAAAS